MKANRFLLFVFALGLSAVGCGSKSPDSAAEPGDDAPQGTGDADSGADGGDADAFEDEETLQTTPEEFGGVTTLVAPMAWVVKLDSPAPPYEVASLSFQCQMSTVAMNDTLTLFVAALTEDPLDSEVGDYFASLAGSQPYAFPASASLVAESVVVEVEVSPELNPVEVNEEGEIYQLTAVLPQPLLVEEASQLWIGLGSYDDAVRINLAMGLEDAPVDGYLAININSEVEVGTLEEALYDAYSRGYWVPKMSATVRY